MWWGLREALSGIRVCSQVSQVLISDKVETYTDSSEPKERPSSEIGLTDSQTEYYYRASGIPLQTILFSDSQGFSTD